MKIICLVLSLFVLTLSTFPDCMDNHHAEGQSTELNKEQKDECSNCSPFLTCGTCSGFTFNQPEFHFEEIIVTTNRKSIPFQQLFSDFCSENIWQPPKFIFY